MERDFEKEWAEFDWDNHKGPAEPYIKPVPLSIISVTQETPYERKMRMLVPLSQTCLACSMCELGLKVAVRGSLGLDPHVLSNMNPTRFMVVGQNPGWNELRKREPFVGDAGKNFDDEISKHGLTRKDFYICNTVRCYTEGNSRPSATHVERCEPFLRMEINIIKPRLVISLGAVAFDQLCPGVSFQDSMSKITKSKKFGVNVFAIYHPSPLNLDEGGKRAAFEEQVELMCGLVTALKTAE